MAADSKQHNVLLGECIVKCVNVILSSRLSTQASTPGPALAKPNRWFQLEVEDWASVRAGLEQACRGDPATPVELEVYCCPAGRPEVVLVERWRICLDTSWPLQPQTGSTGVQRSAGSGSSSGGSTGGRLMGEDGALYKRLTLLVRTLCCHLRILPTHKLLRAYKRQPVAVWRLACRVVRGATSIPLPANSAALHNMPARPSTPTSQQLQHELKCRWSTAPVPTTGGGFRVHVEHIALDAVAALEAMAAGGPAMLAPQRLIINDYLGNNVSQQQPQGRPPLPAAPQANKGMAIPQPTPHTHELAREVGSPGVGGSGTPVTRNSLPRNSLPAPSSASPVVRQSWGRKGSGASLFPPPSPIPITPIHMIDDEDLSSSPASTRHEAVIRHNSSQTPLEAANQINTASPGVHVQPAAATSADKARQPVYASRSVSTPADVAGAAAHLVAAAAAVDAGEGVMADHNRGSTDEALQDVASCSPSVSNNVPSAPVSIPGSHPRVRSLADIRVVYNFPDNPNNPPCIAGATSSRARGLASSTMTAAPVVAHTHGSAPAAPRGMLGQALEAHLATLKAKAAPPGAAAAPTASQMNSAPEAATPPVKLMQPVLLGGEEPVPCTPPAMELLDTPGEGRHGALQQQRSGSFDSNGTQLLSTSVQHQHQVAVPMPRNVMSHHHGRGRQGSSSRGTMAPESPQLPFAFTPAAHSLGVQGARMLGGASIPASPSASSLRTPSGTSLPRQAPWHVPGRSSNSTLNTSNAAPSSSTVITARDVSALALARRPSWIEHSARTGRSNSTSGEPSPSAGPDSLTAVGRLPSSPSLAAQVSSQSPAAAASLPASRMQHLHSSPAVLANSNAVVSVHHNTPSSSGSSGPAAYHQPPAAIPHRHQHAVGEASWLQAPKVSTSLSAQPPMLWGQDSYGLGTGQPWGTSVSPPDLPPLMLVTVPVPEHDAAGSALVYPEAGSQEEDDLPFLLESASDQLLLSEQGDTTTASRPASWVAALKPLCSGPTGQSTSPRAMVLQGGLQIPARDVAVGMLLAHLQACTSSASACTTSNSSSKDCTSLTGESEPPAEPVGALEGAAAASVQDDASKVKEHTVLGGQLVAGSTPLTCAVTLEQLARLHEQLDALLSFSPLHV